MGAKGTARSMAGGTSGRPPILAVCGQESFLKRQAVAEWTARLLGDADPALAINEYDGASASTSLADVLDDLRTLPFLTPCRLVRISDADAFISRCRAELEDYADEPSATGVLILECKSLPANTRLYKRIEKVGQVIKCDAIKPFAAPGWVVKRAKEAHAKTIDAHAAALLCDQVGTDLGRLDAELEKLALYVGTRNSIRADDVELLTGRCREEQVWGILSAMAAGKQAEALALWEQVWQTDRAASARAIGGLAFTVRRLLAAKKAQEAGASIHELRKTMMIWRDDQRLKAELAAFTTDQAEQMLCRLLEADVAAKSSSASVRTSIEKFIIEACRPADRRRATG